MDISGQPDALAYEYTVRAVNASGELSRPSAKFSVSREILSGISQITPDEIGISISGREISLTGGVAGSTLRVFSAGGMLVASATAGTDGSATLTVPSAGLYIAATAEGAVKLIAR